ncbi:MAG TPA: type 2 lanthipeptide synthetase LanM family protein [Thermoanaerobaculia bacterium]|nr:type 2 lanthipeptide synthetase LanM family protein [Thermoanaerobaculia bacterium]
MRDPHRFSLSEWAGALNLSERAADLRSSGVALQPPADPERAARRLGRWRTQNPFALDGFFRRRLALEGLVEDDLDLLLGEPWEAVAARTGGRPDWLARLEHAWTSVPSARFPWSTDLLDGSAQAGFLEAIRPLVDSSFSELEAGIRDLSARFPSAPFDPTTVGELLAPGLPLSLVLLLNRVMVLELHLASQEGRLLGETPEERFGSFIEALRDPEFSLELLRRYPVLARQLAETATLWVEASLEILRHLAEDADRLARELAPGCGLGRLTEISAGQGDAHRRRRSVAFLSFDSGLGLVYKPRPMKMDVAFQDLLEWMATRGFVPAFRRLRVVDAGDHGWSERLTPAPCANAGEVERFYLRQGGYLALLFALSAIDMHHENLIAVGEHPVLVDLEALFHPLDETLGRQQEDVLFPDTVLRIGFLPTADWGGAAPGQAGADLSGLAAMDGQILPRPMLKAEESGTDRMHFSRKPIPVPVGDHRPMLDGAAVDVSAYSGAVVEGFYRMARLLAANRGELLAEAGPLTAFATAPARFLVRRTLAYSNLAFEGQHPYLLVDALDRDRHLDRLWSAVPETPDLERLIAAEHRDLERGDVPVFSTLPSSRDVWTSGGERIPAFLAQAPFECVRDRLSGLDEAGIERQAWIVANSLQAVHAGRNPDLRHEVRETAAAAARDELLDAAVAVGLRLEALSFSRGRGVFWMAQKFQDGPYPCVLGPAGPDLYLGLPGIVLFLAWLGEVTEEPRFASLARGGALALRAQVTHGARLVSSVGGFAGWGGVVYTLTQLGVLWQDEALLDLAEQVASGLGPQIDADEYSDVVGGAAGCLAALLGLHSVRPSGPALPLAVRCGERLLARARPMDEGRGWILDLAGHTPLAGFSHGAAGISWALLKLAGAVGDRRFHEAALGGMEYERSLFRATGGWPDLRQGVSQEQHSMCAWCHGAPGVALGRLDSLQRLDDGAMRQDIAAAVAATLAGGFGKGHSLCHGDLGNLEILAYAAEVMHDSALAGRVGRLAGGVLASIREHGWRSGVLGRGEIPGMMLGLAGIGYGLLRLAAPGRVPSVIRLAAPVPQG